MTTPTSYTPKILFQGALSTTLTTTLVTAPSAQAGVKITGIIITNTGTATRNVTMDYFKATTGRKFLTAASFPPDGLGVDVLGLLGLPDGMIIDTSDLIRGGQDVGTDVDCIIFGIEMS